jgi:hypothetical protein
MGLPRGDHAGQGGVHAPQLVDRHAEAFHDGRRDLLGPGRRAPGSV